MVAVLIVLIGLAIIQASLIVHTRNSLVDAAVQGAHFGALAGSDAEDGAQRAEELLERRYGDALGAEATAVQDPDGTIHVRITATLPLVGLLGPSGTLTVEGRALDEEQW